MPVGIRLQRQIVQCYASQVLECRTAAYCDIESPHNQNRKLQCGWPRFRILIRHWKISWVQARLNVDDEVLARMDFSRFQNHIHSHDCTYRPFIVDSAPVLSRCQLRHCAHQREGRIVTVQLAADFSLIDFATDDEDLVASDVRLRQVIVEWVPATAFTRS